MIIIVKNMKILSLAYNLCFYVEGLHTTLSVEIVNLFYFSFLVQIKAVTYVQIEIFSITAVLIIRELEKINLLNTHFQ